MENKSTPICVFQKKTYEFLVFLHEMNLSNINTHVTSCPVNKIVCKHNGYYQTFMVQSLFKRSKCMQWMKWYKIIDDMPPLEEDKGEDGHCYVLAYHTIYGIGVAWFWKFKNDGIDEQLEEDFKDKYLGSCGFIKNVMDGNFLVDVEEDIDIFEHSPHFHNLGTVTHWMPLPAVPEGKKI